MWLLISLFVIFYGLFRYRRRRMYELAEPIPSYGKTHWTDFYNFSGSNTDIMNSIIMYCDKAMTTEHGMIKCWLGPVLFIATVNPADVEVVIKTCLEKDDLHRFIRRVLGNGVVFAPVSMWKRKRKIIVPAFSPKVIENFVEVFSEQSQILVEQLEAKANTGIFDVWRFISTFTLDSISETVMGTKIHAQTTMKSPFLDSLEYLLDTVCMRIFHLWLQPDWMFKLSSHAKKHDECIDLLHSFADKVITNKKEEIENNISQVNDSDHAPEFDPSKYRRSFLDLLIVLSGKEKGYSNIELREEVLTLMVAGNDTSAVGTSFALMLLGKHQDIQDKIYEELLNVFGTSDRPLVKEDLPKLTYLEYVIKESLRLYPPVPFIIRKVERDLKLPSGVTFPAGAGVVISIWGLHRNPKYWGPDPEKFDPERFSPERYKLANSCAYMPFGGGPRNCLGYQYAIMSAKTVLSTVLRRYKILISDEERMKTKIDVKLNIMLKAKHGYNIALEKREKLVKISN